MSTAIRNHKERRAAKAGGTKKRKYKKLTDAHIMDMLRAGLLWVVGDQVYTRLGVKSDEICDHGYKHIRVYWNNRRKSIAKHRLIWMAANGVAIPEGFDVHHAHGKKCNFSRYLDLIQREAHEELHAEERGYPADWDDVEPE